MGLGYGVEGRRTYCHGFITSWPEDQGPEEYLPGLELLSGLVFLRFILLN